MPLLPLVSFLQNYRNYCHVHAHVNMNYYVHVHEDVHEDDQENVHVHEDVHADDWNLYSSEIVVVITYAHAAIQNDYRNYATCVSVLSSPTDRILSFL